MADWSAARAESVRLFMPGLLVAEISHPGGAGRAAFDPGQSIARSLLCPYLLCLCRSCAALRRSDRTAWPLRHHPARDYVHRADPGGCARGSAQTKGAPVLSDRGSEVGPKTGCYRVFP